MKGLSKSVIFFEKKVKKSGEKNDKGFKQNKTSAFFVKKVKKKMTKDLHRIKHHHSL